MKPDITKLAERYLDNNKNYNIGFCRLNNDGSIEFFKLYQDRKLFKHNKFSSIKEAYKSSDAYSSRFFFGYNGNIYFDPSTVLVMSQYTGNVFSVQSVYRSLLDVNKECFSLLDFHHTSETTDYSYIFKNFFSDSIMRKFIIDEFLELDYVGDYLTIYGMLETLKFPMIVLHKDIIYDVGISPYDDRTCYLKNKEYGIGISIEYDNSIDIVTLNNSAYSGKNSILGNFMRGLSYDISNR